MRRDVTGGGSMNIEEWIGHDGHINKIEGNMPEWGKEKNCFLSLALILAEAYRKLYTIIKYNNIILYVYLC